MTESVSALWPQYMHTYKKFDFLEIDKQLETTTKVNKVGKNKLLITIIKTIMYIQVGEEIGV